MVCLKDYVKEHADELYKLLSEMCHIPAPSHNEQKRAQYCLNWFEENGLTGAYIDGALNVVLPYQAEGKDDLTVFAAHTDTVFPDTEPMPYLDDGERIYCPGVGDDTASLAILMLVAKYFFENKIKTNGVLFVCNSCEEGLGNLKGTRFLFDSYKGRITRFVSFDSGSFARGAASCVGSHRYEVEVTTAGGHSWGAFGSKNAIAELSDIVTKIFSITLPKKEGCKVTYNVGTISGGTSVNTIAQSATMLCEYRSDDLELLNYMKGEFDRIFKSAVREGVEVKVKLVGERPCADRVDKESVEKMKKIISDIVKETVNSEVVFKSGSTDCNIPLSRGIPAIAIGVYEGYGCHTREEYVIKSSLPIGLEIGIRAALRFSE